MIDCGFNDGSEQVAYCLGFNGVSYPNAIVIYLLLCLLVIAIIILVYIVPYEVFFDP